MKVDSLSRHVRAVRVGPRCTDSERFGGQGCGLRPSRPRSATSSEWRAASRWRQVPIIGRGSGGEEFRRRFRTGPSGASAFKWHVELRSREARGAHWPQPGAEWTAERFKHLKLDMGAMPVSPS